MALASKAVGILFSPHGTFTVLIYAELPHEIRLTRTGDVVASFDNLITWGVTFSPSESYWIAVDNDGNLKLYWADGRAAVSLPSKPSRVYVSPDSTYIVVGDMDGSQLYRVGAQVAPRRINGTGQPFFSPDGSYFVMTHLETNRQRIELYHAGTDQVFGFDSAYAVNTLNFSPDQTYFIITYEGPVSAELRRTRDGQLVSYFDRPFGSGYFSPDGRYLLAQFRDGASELWNLESGGTCRGSGHGVRKWVGRPGREHRLALRRRQPKADRLVYQRSILSARLALAESMRHIGSSEDFTPGGLLAI